MTDIEMESAEFQQQSNGDAAGNNYAKVEAIDTKQEGQQYADQVAINGGMGTEQREGELQMKEETTMDSQDQQVENIYLCIYNL